jgi:outer membrane protein TolC
MMRQRCLHFVQPNPIVAWLLLLPLLALSAPKAWAQANDHSRPPATKDAAPLAAAPAPTLSLAECIQTGLEHQPRIAAERASLAAAEDGKRAIDNLRLVAIVDHEIPIRRKQAALGVTAAAAGLDLAERETAYAVTRAYVTVLYAREQERVARAVVDRLSATHDLAAQQLKDGDKDINANDVKRALVYLRQAQAKRVQAAEGVKRALASLKEAVGLGCDVRLDVAAGRLPDPDVRPARDAVVALALARRGDMVQAGVFAEVTCLEVEAQGTSPLKRMGTFAAAADIHARQVPQSFRNSEYRPGALPPEMPTVLVGSRSDRVQHAESLHARAEAAVEVTRNLITLEAEDAFLRWEQASLQVPQAREAADAGDEMAEAVSRDYIARLERRSVEVITAGVLAGQSRAQYNEYLYNKLLALIDLERITAGGFCARLGAAAVPQPKPAAGAGGAPK